MPDRNIKLNGEPVTLKDVGGGSYVIELTSVEARRFIKDGELEEVRRDIDALVEQKRLLQNRLQTTLEKETSFRNAIDAVNLKLAAKRAERDDISAFISEVEK